MKIDEVTIEDIRDLIYFLKNERKLSQVSINSVIGHLKKFFGYLVDMEAITKSPADKIQKGKVDKNPIIPFSDEQMASLLKQPDPRTFKGFRDYCVMLLLADTGMRIGELLKISIEDIDFKNLEIILDSTKNRNSRKVGISELTKKELIGFKEIYLQGFDGKDYFFQNEKGQQLQKRTIQNSIKKYGDQAKIKNVRVSPHTFRHYFAINYLKNGGSTAGLRSILGHLTFNTVESYLFWSDQDIVEQCHKYSPLTKLNFKR